MGNGFTRFALFLLVAHPEVVLLLQGRQTRVAKGQSLLSGAVPLGLVPWALHLSLKICLLLQSRRIVLHKATARMESPNIALPQRSPVGMR